MIDQSHTLLRLLPAGGAELREDDVEQDVDDSKSMHGFATSEMVPLENAVAQKW